MASTVPNCRAYDPAFAGEFAVILDHGMRQMLEREVDEFYYVTLMNENYAQPTLPEGVEAAIIRGLYRFDERSVEGAVGKVRLLGSGTLLREAIAAADLLAQDWQIESEIWSVTSYTELARESRDVERWNRLHPRDARRVSHLDECLPTGAPVVAVSDYVRAVPQLIGSYVTSDYTVLGTDGFGRSDTRARLRSFFEVDRYHIVLAAVTALVSEGKVAAEVAAQVIERYGIEVESEASWRC
jgi:pyruvate dehydrogenase E1 component